MYKSNLVPIAEGKDQKQTTLTMELHPMDEQEQSLEQTGESEIASHGKAASQLNQKPSQQSSDKDIAGRTYLQNQRKLSQQETLRPIVSGGLRVNNIRVSENGEEEIMVSEMNASSMKEGFTGKKDYGMQDSKQTNYLNLYSQYQSKEASMMRMEADRRGSLESQISLNKDLIAGKDMQPKQAVMPGNLDPNDSSQLTSQGSKVTENPFAIKGKKLRINANTNEMPVKHTTIDIPLSPSAKFMQVKVQSTTTNEFEESGEGDLNSEKEKTSSNNVPQHSKKPDWNAKSSPHLLVLEDQQSDEKFIGQKNVWAGATSTKMFGMVSPRVHIHKNVQQRMGDWRKLQISPTANNTKHIQSGDSSLSYLKYVPGKTMQDSEKPKLGDFLAKECQELFKYEDIGYVTESRPDVRLISKQHVDQINYSKALQHRSIGTLEDTGRSYLTMNLEQIDENCHTPEITIQSNPSHPYNKGRMTYELLKNRQGRTVSHVMTRSKQHSAISSPIRGLRQTQRTFASIERLNAFHRNTTKHSHQPYVQPDCKYVLSRTVGETLSTNMRRVYGLKPADQMEVVGRDGAVSPVSKHRKKVQSNGEETIASDDQQGFEYKKVPISKKDGHMLSDVASPEESNYAKRKLLSKQRKNFALDIQNETKRAQLEKGYYVSSPAAKMRSFMFVQQKKRNALAKPSLNANPVLYEDNQALKTWKTSKLN